MERAADSRRVMDVDVDTCALLQRKDPKSELRRRLLTCTALVAVCTWVPLNAASAQVNVIANGTPVDLVSQPTYPNFNSVRAVNGGQITNSGAPPVNVAVTQTQYGVLAGGPGVPSTIGTITLNGVNVTASDPTYTLTIQGPRGLAAEGTGAVLNATNVTINLSHTGSSQAQNGTGLRAVNGGVLTASGGTVTMIGDWNHGIVASGGTVNANNIAFAVNGVTAQAIGAFATGPSSIINLTGSSVTNSSPSGHGLLAMDGGRISLDGGSVTTTGSNGVGLYSFAAGSLIVANLSFGGVQTSGATAHGARVIGGVIELNGTTISTTGAGAHGIFAQQGGRVYPTGATVPVGPVIVTGTLPGELPVTDPAPTVAAGDVAVIFNGNVTATGSLSHGIFADGSTTGNAYVETMSAVMGGWGAGAAGVRLNGLSGFARVNAGSTVGALSDLAISGTRGTSRSRTPARSRALCNSLAATIASSTMASFNLSHFADTNGDGASRYVAGRALRTLARPSNVHQ